ncbi:MAG: hypothetical protein PHU21_09085 [Elusimicrobia bacterium]|nr:hypothetical protein [Elusimicrobiota bacterium]
MKKLLGSALALALLVSVGTANAELLKNFKFGGSVEMSAISGRNFVNFQKEAVGGTGAATDRIGDAQTRIMLNMDWDLLDDVHAKITLGKNNQVYGKFGNGHAAAEDLNTAQTAVMIDQGYFKIDKVFGAIDMTFGRQFYGEPGDLIAYWGPKYDEYGMDITAADGARFDYSGEKAYATVLVLTPARVAGDTGTGIIDAENGQRLAVRGFIVGNKGNENVDGKVYVWNAARHGAAVPGATGAAEAKNDNLYIVGLKAKAKFGGAYGSVEVAKNFGEYRYNPTAGAATGNSGRYAGMAMLINAGLKADVEQIGMFNPWAEFGYGSGDGDTPANDAQNRNFAAIATDYKPGAVYGRFNANNTGGQTFASGANAATAGNGLFNRIIWGVGVKATPTAVNKLTMGVQFYDFNFQNLLIGPGATAAIAGNRHIGSEVDVTGEWKHSENVSLKGTIGNFMPGGYIKNQVNGTVGNHVSSAWLGAMDLAVKF